MQSHGCCPPRTFAYPLPQPIPPRPALYNPPRAVRMPASDPYADIPELPARLGPVAYDMHRDLPEKMGGKPVTIRFDWSPGDEVAEVWVARPTPNAEPIAGDLGAQLLVWSMLAWLVGAAVLFPLRYGWLRQKEDVDAIDAFNDSIPMLFWPTLPIYYLGRFAAKMLNPPLDAWDLPPHEPTK